MKKEFLLLSALIFGGHALADYSSHQFHYIDLNLNQCKKVATDAAVKSGFSSVQTQDFPYDGNGGLYSVVYGVNRDGYSFQYTCESVRGFGYLIVNGSQVDIKNKIRDEIGGEIKKVVKSK